MKDSVPASLLALVSMVLNGPNIQEQSSSSTSQAVLTIAQLLMHNSMIRCREKKVTAIVKHSRERETPLPIYLGMLVHTKTRKRELVDQLFELGLSVSYDRVLEISTQLGHKVCQYYEIQRAVCPQLKCGFFTTAAVDNIDHNLSSTSAQDSFHGTGISLFQHPDSTCLGFPQDLSIPLTTADSKKKKPSLPESYTNVPPQTTLLKQDPQEKEKIETNNNSHLLSQAIQVSFKLHNIISMLNITCNWASEASPTLGCSIEISRDIYIYMSVCCMSVVCQINCVGGITYGQRACSVFFSAVKPVTPVLFISYTLEL